LSLSFVPDGTPIANHTSNLFQALNALEPTPGWQGDILRAIQTWAQYANISVGVVPDGGQAFGTSGPMQGDPRFGDIRIGAQPMSAGVLSVSIPPDPFLSGSWAGDVLLNSAYSFGGEYSDLYTVMLHEFGHVLGLGDSTDPRSVMFPKYKEAKHGLAASDIAAIEALYGERTADPHEGSQANDKLKSATPFTIPVDFEASLPLVTYGDITTRKDVDYFSLVAPGGDDGTGGPMTFRLQTAGISLLEPRLTIYDAAGQVVASAESTNVLGDVLKIQVRVPTPGAVYYAEVTGIGDAPFDIGRYALAVTFDATNRISEQTLSTALRGPYDTLSPQALDEILTNPSAALFNSGREDDSPHTAQPLPTSAGYGPHSHYAFIGSLANSSEQDYFHIQAPKGSLGTTMTVALSAFSVNGLVPPHVRVLDASYNPVPVQVLVNGDGRFTVQATNLHPGGIYYLQVGSGERETEGSGERETEGRGNYFLVVDFHEPATLMTSFASGNLGAGTPQQANTLYVAESQLFQFTLSANAANAPAGTVVQMNITNASGTTVFTLTATVGDPVSGAALFLAPGQYTITFTAITPAGAAPPSLTYQLAGTTLSDPIGPAISDPTLKPVYVSPSDPGSYTYPNGVVTHSPYLIIPLIL
jgi:hypothetical protein